jgi:hypothetical protein
MRSKLFTQCINKSKQNTKKQQPKIPRRSTTKLVGSGAYDLSSLMSTLKKQVAPMVKPMVKSALENGGGMIGSLTNIPGASDIGKKLGSRISKLVGSGDYSASDPPAYNSLFPRSRDFPSFGSTSGSTRIKHREYISDIFTGSTAGTFNNLSLPVNPGLTFVFPYLSQIAANYEKYKFHGLVFEYIATTSPYNSSSAMGSVILSTQFNSSVTPYTNKAQMENSENAISDRFDKSIVFGIECAQQATNEYYCRSGVTVQPIQLTDLCQFQIATQPASTFPTNSTIGELWVTYDIEFLGPRISP